MYSCPNCHSLTLTMTVHETATVKLTSDPQDRQNVVSRVVAYQSRNNQDNDQVACDACGAKHTAWACNLAYQEHYAQTVALVVDSDAADIVPAPAGQDVIIPQEEEQHG